MAGWLGCWVAGWLSLLSFRFSFCVLRFCVLRFSFCVFAFLRFRFSFFVFSFGVWRFVLCVLRFVLCVLRFVLCVRSFCSFCSFCSFVLSVLCSFFSRLCVSCCDVSRSIARNVCRKRHCRFAFPFHVLTSIVELDRLREPFAMCALPFFGGVSLCPLVGWFVR